MEEMRGKGPALAAARSRQGLRPRARPARRLVRGARGEVTALIGDNGAGKSTLMKCLAASIQPDDGEIEVDGQAVAFGGPGDAARLGIETVYQDLALAPDLDAAANVFLGRELRRAALRPFAPRPAARCAGARRTSFKELGGRRAGPGAVPVSSSRAASARRSAIARAAIWAHARHHHGRADRRARRESSPAKVLELIRRVRARGLAVVLRLATTCRRCSRSPIASRSCVSAHASRASARGEADGRRS